MNLRRQGFYGLRVIRFTFLHFTEHASNPTKDRELPYRWINVCARNWARGPGNRFSGSDLPLS